MKITTTNGEANVTTIEAAAAWLENTQPGHASIDGHEIDKGGMSDWGRYDDATIEAIAAAMAEGDWYWLSGSAYCPACVCCDTPAIDADDPLVTRGRAVSRCACCGADYAEPTA